MLLALDICRTPALLNKELSAKESAVSTPKKMQLRFRSRKGERRLEWLHFISQYMIGMFFWGLSKVCFRLEVYGLEHIQALGRQPFIFVLNHKSYVDHFIVLIAFLRARKASLIPIRMMVRDQIYHQPLLHPFLYALGTYPSRAGSGIHVSLAVPHAILSERGRVGIYPEGGIVSEDTIGMFKRGVSVLAQMHPDVKIIPIAIRGTNCFLRGMIPRHKCNVSLVFGAPFHFHASRSYAECAKLLRQKILSLYHSA